MRILASTMGKSLDVFARMTGLIEENFSLDAIGLYLADSSYVRTFEGKDSFLSDSRVARVNEWEVTGVGRRRQVDWEKLARYEEVLGDPTLWNALLADRRVFFGKFCKSRQDYRPRFSYQQMAGIVLEALERLEALFDQVKPDLVLSFGTATVGDYLCHSFARARGIAYFQFKSTKVKNYVALHDTGVGLSSHIRCAYDNPAMLSETALAEAREFIESVYTQGVVYEGILLSSRDRMFARLRSAPLACLKALAAEVRFQLDSLRRNDSHLPGVFMPVWYSQVVQPLRALGVEKSLRSNKKYVESTSQLEQLGAFVLYPLHFEPEVSLQIFGRPFQNQIELVRNLALSVPIGTKILVKEHPRSLGFRKMAYYQKLLDIPNVYLVNPYIRAVNLVRFARAIAVVSGTIGLEAAILEKPVLIFGRVGYEILPETMVRSIRDLHRLGDEYRDLLARYRYDRTAIERYLAATVQGAVPVDLYSVLLRKQNRHSDNPEQASEEQRRERDYRAIGEYLATTLARFQSSDQMRARRG